MSLSLNIEGIILLLFFIAPGFVFTRTYTAYRPRYFREPSAFEQRPVSNYPLPDLALTAFFGVIYLSASLVSARRFGTFLGRGTATDRPRWWNFLLGEDPPEPFLLWHTILQIEPLRLDLIPPYLTVRMRNGEYFEGELYQMRLVGDEDNTVELALDNVRYRPSARDAASGSSPQEIAPLANKVVLLRSTDILWLARNDVSR
jgi:hypothetical protein